MNDHTRHTLRFRTLASGSSGNAMVVASGRTRLLIDVGISLRRLESRLESTGLALEDIDAVALTHEHSDHTSNLRTLLDRRPGLPLVASAGTLEATDDEYGPFTTPRPIAIGDSVDVGDLRLQAFPLNHDAREPTGFRIESNGSSLGIATDLGFWDEAVVEKLRDCQLVFLEANHDVEMLRRGPYPAFLKRRISSSDGHLSNSQARALAARIASEALEHIVLGHLSGKNNTPELAIRAVTAALGSHDIDVHAAPRKAPGPVLTLEPRPDRTSARPRQPDLF